jgi:putative ATPase
VVLWGPPGSGKTTLARVIANETHARFAALSAVLSGVADLRNEVRAAIDQRKLYGKRTILFIDEIHRYSKSQQDALLPHVEDGTVVLIGATTENPSFAINAALLSRARVLELKPLAHEELVQILTHALQDTKRGVGGLGIEANEPSLSAIAAHVQGDARRALDVLDAAARFVASTSRTAIELDDVTQALAGKTLLHDKSGEGHYNVVSAFIKSMRGTDPDAALYWMMRMLEAGEDPLFVLRRMVIFASEDIGNADPHALMMAVAADQAFARLGMPEGLHVLSQCCLYLASAPKSNASYAAWTAAQRDVRERGALEVPKKLRNAATQAMKQWGYGDGYRYPHDEGGYSTGETYLPDALAGRRYYLPKDSGIEARIAERLAKLRK